jgi:hypothetical protein
MPKQILNGHQQDAPPGRASDRIPGRASDRIGADHPKFDRRKPSDDLVHTPRFEEADSRDDADRRTFD